MQSSVVGRLLLAGAILALPVSGFAQEATLTGTVTDSTGGVLPGVTVTAVLEATGNRFEAVTDERGLFRMPVRVGIYQIAAALQGFGSVERPGIQLLAGQTATINLQMSPSTVRSATSYGGDLRGLGAGSVERQRLRPDGTIVPRNAFTQPARNRTNVRIQQRIPLPNRVSVDVMAEAFNVFNRPNWTINAQENNAQYLRRIVGENRTMQFGFRVTF